MRVRVLQGPQYMDVVKWYHAGLQNHCWGFESLHPCKWRRSSGVEHLFHTEMVGGSNPPDATNTGQMSSEYGSKTLKNEPQIE